MADKSADEVKENAGLSSICHCTIYFITLISSKYRIDSFSKAMLLLDCAIAYGGTSHRPNHNVDQNQFVTDVPPPVCKHVHRLMGIDR